jgi:hypothetical protein
MCNPPLGALAKARSCLPQGGADMACEISSLADRSAPCALALV